MTTARNAAMTAAGLAAFGSAMAATLLIWLLLVRPFDVADAVSGHELGGLVRLAFATLQDLLLRFLNLL